MPGFTSSKLLITSRESKQCARIYRNPRDDVQVTDAAIAQMVEKKGEIDWEALRAEERATKHDVMAHNHVFGKVSGS